MGRHRAPDDDNEPVDEPGEVDRVPGGPDIVVPIRIHRSSVAVDGSVGAEGRGDEQRRLVSVTRQMAQRTNSYPSGTRDDDRFIGYASKESGTLWVQFRDNKLINFNPADFARADALRVAVSGGETAAH